MIEISLGIIIGLILSVLILIGLAHFRPAIERTMNRTASIMKKKGEIIEPENEDLQEWVEGLKTE